MQTSDGSESGFATIIGDADEANPDDERPLLDTGATVGRYVVLSVLGRGGMGVVYAAYDPELDRKIALKLLRPGFGAKATSIDPHTRLLREAQALARVSHPNVVTVHDVGTLDDEVFIAMEYIDGESLTQWLAHGHAWPTILDVFRKAGRGLAAAHAAGLIHRDFKPENVLVGKDGRVRVLDFGLARAASDLSSSGRVGSTVLVQSSSGVTLDTNLTRTGATMGTPAYMAPEQHAGGTVDARTDIFGFCVALYEALYRTRPFRGGNLTTLVANVLAGQIGDAPRDSDVPAWVRRALLRGLAVDPTDRPATMDELLRSLAHDPRRVFWRAGVLVALVGGLVLGGLGLGLLVSDDDEQTCQFPDERLAGVWDDTRREQAKAAFAAVERPFAEQAFEHASTHLDTYVADWRAGWVDACQATRIRGEQSDALLDLRMACLQRAAHELQAVSDLMISADVDVVEHAAEMVEGLPELRACADVERLTARVPLPDPDTAAAVEAVQVQLARVHALELAGKWTEALAPTQQVLDAARATGYAPLEAQVHIVRADLQQRTDAFEQAATSLAQGLSAAVRGRDDELAAAITTDMIYVLGYRLGRKQAALERSEESAAWIARLGGDDRLTATRLDRLAVVQNEFGDLAQSRVAIVEAVELRRRSGAGPSAMAEVLAHLADAEADEGDLAAALEHMREALALQQSVYGEHHPAITGALNNLGVYEQRKGNFAVARGHFERVRAIYEVAVGPRSSGVALALTNLGALAREQGQLAEAIADLRLARELYIETRGPEHADVAAAANTLAIALATDHQFEEATEAFIETLALKRKLYGDDSSEVAFAENNVGNVLVDQGKYDEGLPHLHVALEMKRRLLGDEHPTVASTLDTIGFALEQQGHFDDALERYAAALAIYESAMGPESVRVTNALVGIGRCRIARGEPNESLDVLERAYRIRAAAHVDPVELADAGFALAQALRALGSDRERTQQLADAAEAAYAEAGRRGERKLALLREWSRAR